MVCVFDFTFNPQICLTVGVEPDVEGYADQPQLHFFRRTGDFSPKPYGSPVHLPKREGEDDECIAIPDCPFQPPKSVVRAPRRSPPTPQSHSGKKRWSNAARSTTATSKAAPKPISPPLNFSPDPPMVRKRKGSDGIADAYDFGRPDEDEQWSTLTVTKRLKKDLNGWVC